MIKGEKFRTSKKEIAGTTYIVESGECEEVKETPYSKIERLISSNAKELEKARNSLERYKKNSSTSQG